MILMKYLSTVVCYRSTSPIQAEIPPNFTRVRLIPETLQVFSVHSNPSWSHDYLVAPGFSQSFKILRFTDSSLIIRYGTDIIEYDLTNHVITCDNGNIETIE